MAMVAKKMLRKSNARTAQRNGDFFFIHSVSSLPGLKVCVASLSILLQIFSAGKCLATGWLSVELFNRFEPAVLLNPPPTLFQLQKRL